MHIQLSTGPCEVRPLRFGDVPRAIALLGDSAAQIGDAPPERVIELMMSSGMELAALCADFDAEAMTAGDGLALIEAVIDENADFFSRLPGLMATMKRLAPPTAPAATGGSMSPSD